MGGLAASRSQARRATSPACRKEDWVDERHVILSHKSLASASDVALGRTHTLQYARHQACRQAEGDVLDDGRLAVA